MSNLQATNDITNTNFNANQIELIKNTVAKGASTDELDMFMYLASQYNLDPFKKEIWFMKYGAQATIMTSRDGYLKYAQMNPEFEGLISFVVKEGDLFEVDASEYKITHKFGPKRGKILGAWCRCDRKGKKPFIAYVDFDEYNKNSTIWKSYPSAMIQKVAEVFVLKRAFGINGLVTKEEIDNGETPPENLVEQLTITKEQAKDLFDLVGEHKDLVKAALDKFEFKATLDITKEKYDEVYTFVEKLLLANKAFVENEKTIEEDEIEEVDSEVVEEQEEIEGQVGLEEFDEDVLEDAPF